MPPIHRSGCQRRTDVSGPPTDIKCGEIIQTRAFSEQNAADQITGQNEEEVNARPRQPAESPEPKYRRWCRGHPHQEKMAIDDQQRGQTAHAVEFDYSRRSHDLIAAFRCGLLSLREKRASVGRRARDFPAATRQAGRAPRKPLEIVHANCHCRGSRGD